MSSLEDRIRALEDRDAIRQLCARYCFVIDDRDLEGIGECFTADGRFRSLDGKMDARGRDAIMEQYHGRFAALGTGNHIAHQQVIELDADDPDHATGTVSAHAELVRNGEVMIAAFRYADEYRREDGKWRFADRLLSFMYYLRPGDYIDYLDDRLRNHAYGEPMPADIPDGLASYRQYRGAHLTRADNS
jgi:uncharacterized protein (TIGR02246 family)